MVDEVSTRGERYVDPSILEGEPRAIQFLTKLTGATAKVVLPGAPIPVTTTRTDMGKPRYLPFVAQYAGIAMASQGRPDVGAITYVAGKVGELLDEEQRKRAAQKRGEEVGENIEDEPPLVKSIALATAAGSKLLLPAFASARGDIEGKGYQVMINGAKALDAIAFAYGFSGKLDIAAPVYVGSRILALGAELADRNMPAIREKIKNVKENISGGFHKLKEKLKKKSSVGDE